MMYLYSRLTVYLSGHIPLIYALMGCISSTEDPAVPRSLEQQGSARYLKTAAVSDRQVQMMLGKYLEGSGTVPNLSPRGECLTVTSSWRKISALDDDTFSFSNSNSLSGKLTCGSERVDNLENDLELESDCCSQVAVDEEFPLPDEIPISTVEFELHLASNLGFLEPLRIWFQGKVPQLPKLGEKSPILSLDLQHLNLLGELNDQGECRRLAKETAIRAVGQRHSLASSTYSYSKKNRKAPYCKAANITPNITLQITGSRYEIDDIHMLGSVASASSINSHSF